MKNTKWTTARISRKTFELLRKISKYEQRTIPTILERIVADYEKREKERI